MRKFVCAVVSLGLLAVMGYSGARLWRLDEEIKAERSLHTQLLREKPAPEEPEDPLAQLRAQNPDIVGWITVPYTNIDYPIVQARDNDYYLRRDLNGEYATPGTIFMDCRCAPDGADYSILYGHNMKSGSMFGTLKRFGEKAFFDAHPDARLLLADGWHGLEFFAFLVVRANDGVIYGVPRSPGFFADVRARARHARAIALGEGDRVVALSTCSYEFNGARMVLLGKMTGTLS